ncbi:hypothetical protein ES708_04238 [subsurface metagenome]
MEKLIAIYRWTLGYLVFIIGGIILLVVTFLPPEIMRYRFVSLFARTILLALGARVKVEGNPPRGRTCILMANHASFTDIFILAAIINGKTTGIMAQKSFSYPLWGTLLRRLCIIPIQRKNRESARQAICIAEERLCHGFNMIILPEGTRTLTGRMGPLKKGGFHMALNTGAPILPIGIEGAFRLKPKTTWIVRPGPITVRIGEPIPPERYRTMSMEAVMEEVCDQLLTLSGEIPPP